MNPAVSRKKRSTAVVLRVAVTLTGCATASKDIAANYVSTMQYQSHDCDRITGEAQRIHAWSNQLAGRLDEAASNDKAIVGVDAIPFWPALFPLGGTKPQEADYARLTRGDSVHLHESSLMESTKHFFATLSCAETFAGPGLAPE